MNTSTHRNIARFGTRALFLLCASAFAWGERLEAVDFSAGIAALEEGDDRQRPALSLEFGFSDFYAANLYHWGKDHGPFKERGYLLGGMRKVSLFPRFNIVGGYGLGILYERLSLEYFDAPQDNDSEDNYNLGAAIRFGWECEFGPVLLQLDWDAYLFPAGLNGGIFLSTGRKQFLKGGIGIRL